MVRLFSKQGKFLQARNQSEVQPQPAKKRRRVPVSVILVYLLVATLGMGSVTFSSYVSTAEGQSTARVAIMAANATVPVTAPISGAPGERSDPIAVTVTNKENNKVCEVTQRYTIEAEIWKPQDQTTNIPELVCEFYSDQNCQNKLTAAPTGIMNAGEPTSVTYYVAVRWPGPTAAADLAFEIDALQITVIAEQVD